MTATIPPPARPTDARTPEADVAPMFVERWSRRAIAPRPLAPELVHGLFEAARWAPSSSNSQPWLFVYADDAESLARARPLITEQNLRWAASAPLLMFLFARKLHPHTGAPLRTSQMDAGASWMSLALQAHLSGLTAHAMGGFHIEATYDALDVPRDEFTALAAIAVGYPGDVHDLPEDIRAREVPNARKSLHEFAFRGRYTR